MKIICLLATILSILFSGLLLADHKPSHNPGAKVPKEWVLLDRDSNPIGEVVSLLAQSTALVNVAIGGHEAFIEFWPKYIFPNGEAYFISADCTGQVYARGYYSRSFASFRDGAAVIEWPIETSPPNSTERLYIRDEDSPSLNAWLYDFFRWSFGDDGEGNLTIGCWPVNQFSGSVYPVSLLVEDLYELYPPPYSMEKQ